MANEIEQTRGQIDSLILRTLLEQDRYGLEIYNEIKTLDNLIGTVKQPTFYNALKRLESAGLLSSYSGGISNGAKRVYYSITNKGRAYLQDEYVQWQLDDGSLKDFFTDEDYFDDEPVKKQRRTRRPSNNKLNTNDITVDSVEETQFNDSFAANSLPDNKNIEDKEIDAIPNTPNIINAVRQNPYEKTYGIRKFTTYENDAPSEGKTIAEKQKILDDLINYELDAKTDENVDIADGIGIANNISYSAVKNEESLNLVQNLNDNHDNVSSKSQICANDIITEIQSQESEAAKPKFKEFNSANIDYNGSVKIEKISNVNYIDSLNDIYKNKPLTTEFDVNQQNNVIQNTPVYYDDYDEEKIKETSFNKLKQKFALDNIKLKQYVRSNTPGFYIGRYYYSAKLLRDVSVIMYAIFMVFCLISHFAAKSSGITVSVSGLIAALLVGTLLPIIILIHYALLPTRRKYANFNFSLALISSFIVLIVSVVIIVMSAFFGFKVNIADGKTLILPLLVPIIATLLIPLSVVLYGILYNSRRYHLK